MSFCEREPFSSSRCQPNFDSFCCSFCSLHAKVDRRLHQECSLLVISRSSFLLICFSILIYVTILSRFRVNHLIMPKLYHSVPLDEEQSLSGAREKRVWTSRFDSFTVSRTTAGLQKHWAWLAHAMLLSISMALFTLSFCSKNVNPSDPAILEKIGTYCECCCKPL